MSRAGALFHERNGVFLYSHGLATYLHELAVRTLSIAPGRNTAKRMECPLHLFSHLNHQVKVDVAA
jgi:hypothetical protein